MPVAPAIRAIARTLALAAIVAVALPAGSVSAAPADTRATPSARADATLTALTPTLTERTAIGVDRTVGAWTTSAGPQVVNLLDVDPAAGGIGVEAAVPASGVDGLETVGTQAARRSLDGHRVVAAVNGDVWAKDVPSGATAPLGIEIHGGELLTASSDAHPTLGVDASGGVRVGTAGVIATASLPDGVTVLTIAAINKPRPAGGLALFSRRWGTSTHMPAGGVEVVLTGVALPLAPVGTWTATVASITAAGNAAIPAGGLVLSGSGAAGTAIATLPVGSIVGIGTAITPGWETVTEAIGGREVLVHNGAELVSPVTSITTAAHPRTAVAVRADGHLMIVTVDGRWPGYSIGVTDDDLADLLVARGAVEAIGLDGGGSTTALVRRPGDIEATLVNRPSDGVQRPVASALLVVSRTPTGPLAEVVVRPVAATAVVGQTLALVAKGRDAALNGVVVPATSVRWSAAGSGGSLGTGGSLRAASPGRMSVTATAGGFAGTSTVDIVADTFAPVASTPVVRITRGAVVTTSSIPVTVSWAAATDVGTGVARYELRRRDGVGYWVSVRLAAATSRSAAVRLPVATDVQFEVRATDRAGNIGGWRSTSAIVARLVSDRSSAVRTSGTWTTLRSTADLDGSLRAARAAGATLGVTASATQIAWIGERLTSGGSARVTADGTTVATVSLRSSVAQPRRVIFSAAWSSFGRHVLGIRVAGTAGHPWVTADGFAVVAPSSTNPVLVGAGDIASCGLTADSATAKLIDAIPGTVFTAGDEAYETGSTTDFTSCYGPTWGRFRARTLPVPGNHEYGTAGAAPYFAYFGGRAGVPGQGWYAYDLYGWRIYALNANCTLVGGCGAGSAQETWLRADLAAHPRACVAAIWHQPLFSSGVHGGDPSVRALWQDLYDAGAELVLNGHDHDYERFAPQRADGTADPASGIREFVVGTGGAALRPFATTQPNSVVRQSSVHGVLKLTLQATGYAWKFVPVAGSTWTDAGSAPCH